MLKMMIAVGLASVAVAGCASDGAAPSSPSPGVARGAEVAALRCAGCHSIDGRSASPAPSAPTFRQLRMRFNQITWERILAEIREGGHDEMPPVYIDDTDIRDVRAYIQTLR